MNRRNFIASTTTAGATTLLGLKSTAQTMQKTDSPAANHAANRPNLLFIMVDDLNLALGCYGHSAAYTPNLDRLAARGLRFQNAFCPYPLCGPSRSALFTGQRPESFPMPINEVSWRDLRPELHTLPELARQNGYHTAAYGKLFHHGIQAKELDAWRRANPDQFLPHTFDDPPSWDESFCEKAQTFERSAEGPEQVIDGPPFGGTSLHTIRVTNPEVLPDFDTANRAIEFLSRWVQGSQSEGGFFLGVGFQKPHVPLVAPEKWWAYYDSLDVEKLRPPTWFHPAELPPGTLKQDRFHRDATEAQRQHLYKGYLACVSHMDEQLGRVLNALDANGLADNTLVSFVADHGYHIGEQAQWDKMMLLDPSLHIPLILAGPGIPHGRTCAAIVESLDLFPTLRSLLSLPPTQATAATDLSPWIADPDLPSDRPAFAWVNAAGRQGWTIRTATHRYGEMSFKGAPAEPYLFDYRTDPDEARNLAGRPEVEPLQAALAARRHLHSTTIQI